MIDLIPASLKDRLFDALVDFVATQAERAGGTALGQRLRALLASDGKLRGAIEGALRRAVTRFEREYADVDEDLVAAIRAAPEFWENAEVRRAVAELVARPGGWGEAERAAVVAHFATVLPERRNRERVDRAAAWPGRRTRAGWPGWGPTGPRMGQPGPPRPACTSRCPQPSQRPPNG
jgi:hypothetical protein